MYKTLLVFAFIVFLRCAPQSSSENTKTYPHENQSTNKKIPMGQHVFSLPIFFNSERKLNQPAMTLMLQKPACSINAQSVISILSTYFNSPCFGAISGFIISVLLD